MRFKHVELPVEAIPDDVRLRAEGAAIIAAQMLEMPRPTVKYFATMPCPDDETGETTTKADALFAELGRAVGVEDAEEPLETWYDEVPELGLTRRREPNTIHLMAFAEPFDLVRTAAHEIRHVAQFACFDIWKSLPPALWERDADRFGEETYLEIAARIESGYQRARAKLAAREANRYRWVRGNRGLGY